MARVPLAGTNYIPGASEARSGDRPACLSATSSTRSTTSTRTGLGDGTAMTEHGGKSEHTQEATLAETVRGEPEKIFAIDSEYLSGRRLPYQEDISLLDDVDLLAATPGADINWLEDVKLLAEGVPAVVFDRYSNSFIKIYFPIPAGREDEIARKVLIKHLQSGNSYGIQLKERCTASSRSPSSARGSRVPAWSATLEMTCSGASRSAAGGPPRPDLRVRREARVALRRVMAVRAAAVASTRARSRSRSTRRSSAAACATGSSRPSSWWSSRRSRPSS